jgi:hypothetical protein
MVPCRQRKRRHSLLVELQSRSPQEGTTVLCKNEVLVIAPLPYHSARLAVFQWLGETTSSTRSPYLRRKIDDGSALRLIHTIRGVGYELSGARK